MPLQKKTLCFTTVLILFFVTAFVEINHVKVFPVYPPSEIVKVYPIYPPNEQPKQYYDLSRHERKEVDCLTKNVYFEAGGETPDGWLAVAMVTMNRVYSGKFPDNICDVVYHKTGNFYQFSWVGSKKRLTKPDEELYNKIRELAFNVYMDYKDIQDITNGALFFHADYVNPKWNREKTAKIGRHIFYR